MSRLPFAQSFFPSLILALILMPLQAYSADQEYATHGDYKIFHSAFNSVFIDPQIASAYNIVRGKDKGLVNIAVVRGSGTGQAATVEGYVSNIFQQQQVLEFFQVSEQNAVYYLAPFEFENEDFLTFKIKVTPAQASSKEIKFQKIMYHD